MSASEGILTVSAESIIAAVIEAARSVEYWEGIYAGRSQPEYHQARSRLAEARAAAVAALEGSGA